MATISRLSVSLLADPRGFNKGIRSAEKAMDGFTGRIKGVAAVGGALAGIGIGVFANNLIDVNAKFQTLMSSLKTVTGGAENASAAFDLIENFAKTTPFDLNQVVESFIKLKARGLDPSERALKSYGNTASAMSKSLDQMIEAVADASTGQFTRLEEFGINASSQGDEVTFTFQGVATTVKKTSEDIEGYLMSIGNVNFAGAMSDQMGNLTPALSNFGAAFEGLQVVIGEAGVNQLITDLVTSTTRWIESLDEEQITQFVQSALGGLADIVEGSQKVVDFLDQNPFLAEAGIIGYLLFGKKGVAAVAAGQYFINQLGTVIGGIAEEINGPGLGIPEQVAALNKELMVYEDMLSKTSGPAADLYREKLNQLATEIGRLNSMQPVVGPTGDFISSANIGDTQGFAEFAQRIREQTEEDKKQTGFLNEIADSIRGSIGATAQ